MNLFFNQLKIYLYQSFKSHIHNFKTFLTVYLRTQLHGLRYFFDWGLFYLSQTLKVSIFAGGI